MKRCCKVAKIWKEEEEDYDIISLVERQRRGAQSKTDRDWGKGGGYYKNVSHY